MSSTCQYCRNPATPTQGLVMGDNGRMRHVWPDEHDDGPLSPPLCPPLAPGFGSCSGCGVVEPFVCRRCASGTSRSSRGRPGAKPDNAPRADDALAAFKSARATDVNSLALALDVSVDRARKQVQRLKRTGLIEVVQGGQRGRPETLRAAGEGWLLPGDA